MNVLTQRVKVQRENKRLELPALDIMQQTYAGNRDCTQPDTRTDTDLHGLALFYLRIRE